MAEAIVETLRNPRFDVYVPKSIGPISTFMAILPRRGREAVVRALRADTVLQVDPAARRAYELRAARSEPGLESPEEQKELMS